MRRDDEDDRSGEAGGASWVDRIVIPDDLSELDAEVRALRRERRVQRRRQRLRRLTGSHRAGAPLLLVALLLIAGVAGLLVMFQPRRSTGVTALGAAQATDRRLPDTVVTLVDGTTRRIREFRPAVFALAPIGCRCDDQLLRAGTASHRHNLAFYLVDRSLPPLPRGLTDTSIVRLVEPSGTVAARYNAVKDGKRVPGGPVLVLVGPGGDVVRVLPEASPNALESELSQLVPEASAATS